MDTMMALDNAVEDDHNHQEDQEANEEGCA